VNIVAKKDMVLHSNKNSFSKLNTVNEYTSTFDRQKPKSAMRRTRLKMQRTSLENSLRSINVNSQGLCI
jgi:hypothetical protein